MNPHEAAEQGKQYYGFGYPKMVHHFSFNQQAFCGQIVIQGLPFGGQVYVRQMVGLLILMLFDTKQAARRQVVD